MLSATLEPVGDQIVALFAEPLNGPEDTFVLFEDATPVGTASLTHHDLTVRPDPPPRLAGVVVLQPYRGRGYAPLVRHWRPSHGTPLCLPMALHLDRRSAL